MSRYIDTDKFPTRDFVIDVLYDCGIRADISVEDIADEIFEMFSSNIPTADVRENVYGEWVLNHMSQLWECSNCHKEEIRTTDFCPRCGADMRKEVEK